MRPSNPQLANYTRSANAKEKRNTRYSISRLLDAQRTMIKNTHNKKVALVLNQNRASDFPILLQDTTEEKDTTKNSKF